MHFTGAKSLPKIILLLKHKNCLARMKASEPLQCLSQRNNLIKLTLYDETK